MNLVMAHWGVWSPAKFPRNTLSRAEEETRLPHTVEQDVHCPRPLPSCLRVQLCMLCMKLSSRWQQSPNKITQDHWLTSRKGFFFICPKLKYKVKVVLGKFREDCIPVGDESGLPMPLTCWAS